MYYEIQMDDHCTKCLVWDLWSKFVSGQKPSYKMSINQGSQHIQGDILIAGNTL